MTSKPPRMMLWMRYVAGNIRRQENNMDVSPCRRRLARAGTETLKSTLVSLHDDRTSPLHQHLKHDRRVDRRLDCTLHRAYLGRATTFYPRCLIGMQNQALTTPPLHYVAYTGRECEVSRLRLQPGLLCADLAYGWAGGVRESAMHLKYIRDIGRVLRRLRRAPPEESSP